MFFKINFTIGFTLLMFGWTLCNLEDCDVKRQRRCRHAVVEELDKQSKSLSTHELEFHCKRLGENLNCLILQVSQCPTPNRSGDLMLRTWKHMQASCDQFEGWWNYECFHLDEMKKCEKIFALRDGAVSQASCREYDRFRHCILDVVKKHCDPEDMQSAGNYLLDSSVELVWTCPHSNPLHRSPAVDTGFVGVKNAVSFEKSVVLPRQPQHPLTAIAPLINIGVTKGHPDNRVIHAEESRLRGVYSSALTGDSPFVTGCNARATEEMRGCLDRHQYERDQALGARDSEDRLRKTCCSTWNYRRCVQNAVRIHCYDSREIDVQSANDIIPNDRDFLCREHWVYKCSSAHGIFPKTVFQSLAIALAIYLCFGKVSQI